MAKLYTPAINEQLREQLSALGCRRGKFDCTGDGSRLSLAGTRPDGRAAFKWAFPQELHRALAAYLENCCPPGTSRLSIRVDLDADTFHYGLTTAQAEAQLADTEAQQELERRRQLPRDQTPYGRALAERVADTLERGHSLGYSHRDYCGFGLEYAGGEFRYGAIWDGGLDPDRTFADRAAFVTWLAAQSDAALSQADKPDPWVWDNQTLTRARLAEFARGQ
jgi:hypothetical protein